MRLRFTRRKVRETPIGAMSPAGVAVGATLAGSPTLITEWLTQAIKNHCFYVLKDEGAATAAAWKLLSQNKITVEIV